MEMAEVKLQWIRDEQSTYLADAAAFRPSTANSGIGFELAAQLVADASRHVLLGSRSAEKGAAAVKDLESRGHPGTVQLLQVDVSSDESITNAARTVEKEHGR